MNLHKDFGDSAKLFIIDEVSMFGQADLLKLNLFLQAAFPVTCTEPFGEAYIIFLGDFYQLKPIGKKPLYDMNDELAKSLWIRDTEACVILSQQMRHVEQVNSEIDYAALNMRARTGTITNEDILALNSRVLWNTTGCEFSLPSFASKIPPLTPIAVFTNAAVDIINNNRLKAHNMPIVNSWAKHTFTARNGVRSQVSCLNANAMKLDALVQLSIAAPVMLIDNIATELGLVNGSIGIIHDIMYDTSGQDGIVNPQANREEACESQLAIPIVLVKFPSYTGQSFITGVDHIVPIHYVKENNETNTFFRLQLPLRLAYAMTIHKCQGMTLSSLALDLSNATARGLSYVGISRVRMLDGLTFRNAVIMRNFTGAAANENERKLHKEFGFIAVEYECLEKIFENTKLRYANWFNFNLNI